MKKELAPFKYSGRKLSFVDEINSIYHNMFFSIDSKNLTYIEPFCGSASVFYNLTLPFADYVLNDLDPNVTKIHKTIKENPLSTYNDFLLYVKKNWPSLKDKETYYDFRDHFNKNVWQKNDPLEGFWLQLLYNTCINSMARFGPNGFNQGWGDRYNQISNMQYSYFHKKLQNVTLYNLDFFNLMKELNIKQEDQFLFLDPPYIRREAAYETISEDFYDNFMNFLKNHKGKFIYTDIDENQLNMNKLILRDSMNNTAPSSSKEDTCMSEVAYYNF